MQISFEELVQLLTGVLQREVAAGELWAEPLKNSNSFYLATNLDGDLLFLIRESVATDRPDRDLMSLRIEFGIYYKAEKSGVKLDGRFTSIKLKSKFPELREPFCALIAALVSGLSDEPTTQEIRDFVESFTALFVRKPGVPRDRIKGLWGELQFILQNHNVDQAVEAWHDTQWGSRDFAFEESYVEIKTTESPSRSHEFSLSQLNVRNKPLVIGSFLIDEEPTGVSVLELHDNIRKIVRLDLGYKVASNFFAVVGQDIDDAASLKFAMRGGKDNSFKTYSIEDVPTPFVNVGDPISSVRFKVDLTTIPPLDD